MFPTPLAKLVRWLAVLLVVKVTVAVVLGYRNYFPPNFQADFLLGREAYFFGSYRWAFSVHLFAGPLSLILGLLLISTGIRRKFPSWHRKLGRVQALNILLLLTPSGLWMAAFAQAGPIAGASFAVLSVVTASCLALGWRTAVQRKFASHERWMMRTFVLLCSAVLIRVQGGLASVTQWQLPGQDIIAAWACWLVPLLAYESWLVLKRRSQQRKMLPSKLPPGLSRHRQANSKRTDEQVATTRL